MKTRNSSNLLLSKRATRSTIKQKPPEGNEPASAMMPEPVAVANSKSLESKDTSSRTKKVKRRTQLASWGIEQLPEDLLLNILCRISAEELLSVCKCVCKSWLYLLDRERYNLSFVNLNLLYSTPYVIIEDTRQTTVEFPYSNIHAATFKRPKHRSRSSSNQFEIFESCYDWMLGRIPDDNFRDCWCDGTISATSSDGIFLVLRDSLCVVNPLTRQLLELPSIGFDPFFGAIARIPSTGKFKVLIYTETSHAWYVITVGTNMSWKKLVDLPPKYYSSAYRDPKDGSTVSVLGVIYVPFLVNSDFGYNFVAFDLNDETASSFEIPAKCKIKSLTWRLLHMGDHLGFVGAEDKTGAIKIWILKDFHRSEWMLILDIDLFDSLETKQSLCIRPHFWVESSQALVMFLSWSSNSRSYGSHWAYYVNTKKLGRFKKTYKLLSSFIFRHSLTPLY